MLCIQAEMATGGDGIGNVGQIGRGSGQHAFPGTPSFMGGCAHRMPSGLAIDVEVWLSFFFFL